MKITTELVEKNSIKLLLIGITTVGAIFFDISGQVNGASIFAPLLFFLPIILAAYWYPQKGVLYAVGIGILQLLVVSQFTYPDLAPLTYATATASFYVLVAVSVVVSALSGNLKLQEARYQAIFDGSQAGVVLVAERAGTLVIEEVNKSAGASLGYLPKDLAGAGLISIWDDPPAFQKTMDRLGKELSISDIESSFLTHQGTSFPVLVTAARLPEHHLVFTFMDITSIREAEARLKRRNNQLTIVNEVITITSTSESVYELLEKSFGKIKKLLPVTSGAIYLLDPERQLLESHYHSGEMNTISSLPMNIPAGTPPFNDILLCGNALYATYTPGGNEVNPQQLSAIIPISCESKVIGLLCLVNPKTEPLAEDDRVVLESIGKEIGCAVQKLRLSDNLVEANRKANLYLDILVHDINNANLASLGYGELLTEMLSGKEKEVAGKLIEGVLKSREVIRNLDTIRHIQERKFDFKVINLDALIKQEIRHYPSASIDYTGYSALVMADDLLAEVLTNLIGNSAKFGGPGVHIDIRVQECPDNYVKISISDEGPGVPDELKSVIFVRFQTGEEKGSGKGLGLFIAKTLVERYGGRIWVEDRIKGNSGCGAAFVFTLPKANSEL
jgi:PAS domain S-box-containing protein